jgi:hypothetical protein
MEKLKEILKKFKLENPKFKLIGLRIFFILIVLAILVLGVKLSSRKSESSTNLKEILTQLNDKSLSWNSDSAIESCETKDFNNQFELSSFSCNIYSPSLNQTRLALWKSNEVTLSNPITLNAVYKKSFETKKSILDIDLIDIDLTKFIKDYSKLNKLNIESTEFFINYDGITKFDKTNVGMLRFNSLTENKPEVYINLSTKEIIK